MSTCTFSSQNIYIQKISTPHTCYLIKRRNTKFEDACGLKIQANAMFSGKVKYLDTIMEKLLNDLNGYKFKNCLLSLFFLNNEKALKQGLKYAARERVQCGPRTSEKMKILKEILSFLLIFTNKLIFSTRFKKIISMRPAGPYFESYAARQSF